MGETAEFVVRAAASQFDSGRVEIRRVPFMREIEPIPDIIKEVKELQGILVYTLVLPEVKEAVEKEAREHGVCTVDIMGPVIDALGSACSMDPHLKPGLVYRMDEEYFRKVEAIEFAVKYDDGKDPNGALWADVVVVGVSRTSKTPLCVYLAHHGFKAANVPLVPEIRPPDELFQVTPGKVVGLTINPDHLTGIREERLKNLGLKGSADYANVQRILEEMEYAQDIMKRLRCPVINVTNRAIEETAEKVMQYIRRR